jgi:hypothetical protein
MTPKGTQLCLVTLIEVGGGQELIVEKGDGTDRSAVDIQILVGGLEHEFYFPFGWQFHHPN